MIQISKSIVKTSCHIFSPFETRVSLSHSEHRFPAPSPKERGWEDVVNQCRECASRFLSFCNDDNNNKLHEKM